MANKLRRCWPTLAELIDRFTINQIKEVLIPENSDSFAQEIKTLMHDIDLLLKKKKVKASARFIRLVIVLAQVNLHIWKTKEKMQSDANSFDSCMKLAHQLNGIRNQIKNMILEETGYEDSSAKKTNTLTDNLQGWNISI